MTSKVELTEQVVALARELAVATADNADAALALAAEGRRADAAEERVQQLEQLWKVARDTSGRGRVARDEATRLRAIARRLQQDNDSLESALQNLRARNRAIDEALRLDLGRIVQIADALRARAPDPETDILHATPQPRERREGYTIDEWWTWATQLKIWIGANSGHRVVLFVRDAETGISFVNADGESAGLTTSHPGLEEEELDEQGG